MKTTSENPAPMGGLMMSDDVWFKKLLLKTAFKITNSFKFRLESCQWIPAKARPFPSILERTHHQSI
jgi:hypothetical protein